MFQRGHVKGQVRDLKLAFALRQNNTIEANIFTAPPKPSEH